MRGGWSELGAKCGGRNGEMGHGEGKSQEEGGRGAWEGEEGGREAAGGALLDGIQSMGYSQ